MFGVAEAEDIGEGVALGVADEEGLVAGVPPPPPPQPASAVTDARTKTPIVATIGSVTPARFHDR